MSVSVSASLAPRVGGWLAYNGFSVPASLLTESSLYSVLTQRIPGSLWQDTIPPPHSEALVGKKNTRIVSDCKLGGGGPDPENRQNSWVSHLAVEWWKNAGPLRFTSFCRNARGLIVWENNLGKWKRGGGERSKGHFHVSVAIRLAWVKSASSPHRPATYRGTEEGKEKTGLLIQCRVILPGGRAADWHSLARREGGKAEYAVAKGRWREGGERKREYERRGGRERSMAVP